MPYSRNEDLPSVAAARPRHLSGGLQQRLGTTRTIGRAGRSRGASNRLVCCQRPVEKSQFLPDRNVTQGTMRTGSLAQEPREACAKNSDRRRHRDAIPFPELPPFVRPAGGAVETLGTPFVPTGSTSRGAQERSRMPKAPRRGGRRRRSSLTAPSTVALAEEDSTGRLVARQSRANAA